MITTATSYLINLYEECTENYKHQNYGNTLLIQIVNLLETNMPITPELQTAIESFTASAQPYLNSLYEEATALIANGDRIRGSTLLKQAALILKATQPQPTQSGPISDDIWTTEITQANTFSPCTILVHKPTGWGRAQADKVESTDIWLCTSATPTSFKIANTCRIYNCPNHGLGQDNSVLFLSPTQAGVLTSTTPIAEQIRLIMGVIFDQNRIFWRPNISVEVV